jgi:proline iminopeptidase
MPTLPLTEGHVMYYRERGNPLGKPVVILHGGPGGALESKVPSRSFDLTKWRVIQYDQRGCGRSTPTGLEGLKANTTWHLVADIERLRSHLDIEKWLIFGGSWGSTLALAYAEKHPERVSGIVIRGIYLGDPWETDWLYKEGGASQLNPVGWASFASAAKNGKTKNLTRAYHRLLHSSRRATRKAAARAWTRWEHSLSFLEARPDRSTEAEQENMALVENHYFSHNCWLKKGQLLTNAKKLSKIPTTIVQGRYDLVCPPISAYQLKATLPHATLVMTTAGHAGSEPETKAALRKATDKMLTV